ncbi:MAG: hypothetical protein RJA07_1833 [Bacteroidota bacterium]|jgi:signal transduction histidine kinase
MKLFKRYNNWFLRIVALLLIVGSVVIYFLFTYLFAEELNEQMQFQKLQLITHPYTFINPPTPLPIEGVFSEIANKKGADSIKKTQYYDYKEKEYTPFQEIIFYKANGNNFIKFTVRKSTIEESDLLYTLIVVIIFIFILFCIILYFLNRKISSNLFGPFFNTIERIKQHKTFSKEPLQLPKTRVEEFTLLNKTLNDFDSNLRKEYKKVSQFTDNASHELQTPIAIVSNRIESILENSLADEKTKSELYEIFETVQQMKKTNETLLLLSRLENKSFNTEVECNLSELLNAKVEYYTQFGFLNELNMETSFHEIFSLKINKEVATILIDNLLNNAIKHNIENGFIKITTTADKLIIQNSGLSLYKPAEEMFNRFERNNASSHGTGLGLSIVHEICSLNRLSISYSENAGFHTITIVKKF